MTDATPKKPSGAQKIVLIIMAVFLSAMFLSSMLLRMQSPTMRVNNERPPQGMGAAGGMGGDQNMAEIGKLMTQMKEKPDDPALLMELGHRLMGMGDYENAEVFLVRAQAMHPSNATLHQMMGVNLFHQERYQEAADQFSAVLEDDKNNPNARFNLGMLYNHYLDRPGEAKHLLEGLMEEEDLDPDIRSRVAQELQGGMHEENTVEGN